MCVSAHVKSDLPPPTDYLYRVSAENSAGSVLSPWIAAMTAESGRRELHHHFCSSDDIR